MPASMPLLAWRWASLLWWVPEAGPRDCPSFRSAGATRLDTWTRASTTCWPSWKNHSVRGEPNLGESVLILNGPLFGKQVNEIPPPGLGRLVQQLLSLVLLTSFLSRLFFSFIHPLAWASNFYWDPDAQSLKFLMKTTIFCRQHKSAETNPSSQYRLPESSMISVDSMVQLQHEAASCSTVRVHSAEIADESCNEDAWAPASAPWPTLSQEALPGFVGEFVSLATRNSEADPAAVLATFLVHFSAELISPYIEVGDTVHRACLFAAIVGASSKSRKGTSAAPVKKLFSFDELSGYAPATCIPGPLSSGEGLVYAVRDEVKAWKRDKETGEGSMVIVDPGILDKRLFVLDEELAAALNSTKRGGNTLSTTLRCLWDHGNSAPLTKLNRISTTGAHVTLLTHITTQELAALLGSVQVLNGFANRFLWVCAKRRGPVPFPESMPEAELTAFRGELLSLLTQGKDFGRISMAHGARALWEAVYPSLTQDHHGLAGCIINRGEAQVLRLALNYALLDGQQVISEHHLSSALAFWRYCHESAMVIFGQREADPVADKVLNALRSGSQSLTDLHRALGNNLNKDRIKGALEELAKSGRVQCTTEQTVRRPKTVFKLYERNEFNEISPSISALVMNRHDSRFSFSGAVE